MYKRRLIVLSAALALGLSVGAAACGTADIGGEDPQPVPAVWQFDEEGHWHAASEEKLRHVDEDGDGVCDVCGYRSEPAALDGEEEEGEKSGDDDSNGDLDEETAPVWNRAGGKLAASEVVYEFEYASTEDGLALRVRADGGECEVLSVRAADGDRKDLYFAQISSAAGEQVLFLDLGGEFFFEEVRSADLTGYEGTLLYYADGERGVFVYARMRAGTVSEVSGAKGGFSHRQGNVGVYWVSLPYETGTLYFALTETEEDVTHAAAAECQKAVLTTEDGEYGLEYLVAGGKARAIIALNGRDGQPAFRGDIQWASDGLAFRYLNGERVLCVVRLAQTLAVYEGDRAILTLSDLGVLTFSFEEKGALVRLPVPEAAEGYVFSGWFYYTVDESFHVVYGEKAGEELVADGDVNLIAVYDGNTYAVNVQTGGAQESIEISPAVAGTYIRLPVPTREGFLFLGWKVRDGDGNEVECTEEQGVYRFRMPSASVTAEACWANAAYGTDGDGRTVTVGYRLSEDGEIAIAAIGSGGVVRTQGISGGRLFSFDTASGDRSAPIVFAYAALGETEDAQAYLLLFTESVLVLPASFVTAEDGAYGTLALVGGAQDFPVLVRIFETEEGSAVAGAVTETERIGETTVYTYEGEGGRFFVLLSDDGRQTAVYASAVRITYSTDGGSADLFPYGFVEAGGTLTLPPSPEREGYSFAGWRLTDGEGNEVGLYAAGERVSGLSCDLFAAAVWEEIVYTVTFVNGEEERTLFVRYAETLESAGFSEIEPPSKPYFVFDGWYCGETVASASFVPYGDAVFTARFMQTEAIPSEVQSPSETQPIEYGTADNVLTMTNLTPVWVGKLQAGEQVSFTGTLTSAADYARYSPYLYLFTGIAPDYYIRADGYVYGQPGDAASSATVNGGTLTVTKTSAAIDETAFCSVIAEAAITVTFDWSDLSVIRISIVLDGVSGGEILREFTVTPAAGQTLAEEYSIGFGGDHCHVVFTSRTAT